MTRPPAGFGAGLLLLPVLTWACAGSSNRSEQRQGSSGGQSGSSATTGGDAGTAGAGGTARGGSGGTTGGSGGGSGSGSGGKAGAGSGGAAGAGTGGTAGAGTGGTSGDGGTAGSSAGEAGSGGMAGGNGSPTACSRDEDCVVAEVYVSNGCCSRRCGTALNADYVASDPCSTVDAATDPVPAECSAGCLLCPAADPRCPMVDGAVCTNGTCTLVPADEP